MFFIVIDGQICPCPMLKATGVYRNLAAHADCRPFTVHFCARHSDGNTIQSTGATGVVATHKLQQKMYSVHDAGSYVGYLPLFRVS